MSLPDEHPGVMDALGQAQLEDLGLEAALQEVLDLQAQHVIELHASLVENADADETSQKCVALEQATRVLKERQVIRTGRLQKSHRTPLGVRLLLHSLHVALTRYKFVPQKSPD